VAAAAERAARDLDPPSDPHGSAAFRRHLAVVMTRRSVQRAAERAREGAANA
jgi:aerobic carbon-monoxide dehydrogenase medium subunit